MKKAVLLFSFQLLLFTSLCFAQTLAPGSPGKDAQWASAGKQGVGTSASLESKVWFTLQGGALTEVYYPNVAVGNVHLLQFVVVNPQTKKVETERDDATHEIKVLRPDSLTFQQVNTAKSGQWKITKTYTTDVERDTVLIDVKFEQKNKELNLYIYYDPSLGNSGMGDNAYSPLGSVKFDQKKQMPNGSTIFEEVISNNGLGADDGKYASAINLTSNITELVNGFYGVSDGLEQLKKYGKIENSYSNAQNGNVVQLAKILEPEKFTVALSFVKGTNVQTAAKMAFESLGKGFTQALAEYEKGWSDYVKTLRKVNPKYQAQFNMAAMVLKAHEDKTYRGANIASLSVPWGGGDNANEDNVGGYHLVWSRDLYQVFTAYMALGDRAAAERALDFLLKVQQKPDGSFPQNSWLDGKPFWGSLQHDEVAYPLIMAYQLGKTDKETYQKHLKKAADFIVRTGPSTPQERWEEEGGFSPSTIAAEIAGLVCAAEIARKNGDEASALIYLATADDWARKIEMWTATTTGKYGDGNYYLRITQNGNPDAGEKIELNNGAGVFDEREIVDAGFLELVRLGIKPADDPLIMKSVKVIDEVIKVDTPNGEAFYRYNNDGYGEMDDGRRWNWDGKYTGKGRLWAFLSGERGQYELALAKQLSKNAEKKTNEETKFFPVYKEYKMAELRLEAMQRFANEGLMIPEQIWDKKEVPTADSQFSPNLQFGEGTGSATPLAWSMAQFIRLAVNLEEGKNLDTPDVVYKRYVKNGIPPQISDFGGMDEMVTLPLKPGENFKYERKLPPGSKAAYMYRGETKLAEVNEKGEFSAEIKVPEKEEIAVVGYQTPDGSTAFERAILRSASEVKKKEYSADLQRRIANSKTSPYIADKKAYFYYTGKANSVMLAGDFSNWSPRIQLDEIEEDFFVYEMDLKNSARVEYKLVVDGKWITDPMNPNKLDNGVGGINSVLEMPGYKPTVWNKDLSGSALDQKVSELELDSQKYGKRTVKIYIPSAYYQRGVAPKLPVLYLFDGSDYLKRARAIEVLENLGAAKKVEPFMLVFTDPVERMKEYFANDDFADYIANEVVPAVEKKYFSAVKTGRENRALLGASLGGVTSVWIGLKHPDKFANIGGQSSSFWVENEKAVKALEKLKGDEKFNFYFDDGTFEGVEDSRRVNVLLRGKGFPVTYIEGETGHNWTSWKDRLADAFMALMK